MVSIRNLGRRIHNGPLDNRKTEDENKRGLYKSTDAGASWEHLNSDFGLVVRPFYFSRIVIDPKNPDVVVKAGLFGSISRDGGKTFKNMGNMHADIHDILLIVIPRAGIWEMNKIRILFPGFK